MRDKHSYGTSSKQLEANDNEQRQIDAMTLPFPMYPTQQQSLNITIDT